MNTIKLNNPSPSPETYISRIDALPAGQIISALEKRYATNAVLLVMLSAIANKIQEVPLSVQATVAELLRNNLRFQLSNTELMTAAIMAMNPQKTITDTQYAMKKGPDAANDEKFLKAA